MKAIRKHWVAYLFILPNFAGVLVFLVFPLIFAFVTSFTKWDMLSTPEFIGLQNYITMFTKDNLFWVALKNTIVYVILVVPASLVVSLLLAVAMNLPLRGISFFRTAYFVPVITSAVAMSFVWGWIFSTDSGLLNGILRMVGLPAIGWLTDERYALVSLSILAVWKNAGYYAVILLAGLQSIPEVLHEAAAIDGANVRQRFFWITIPMLAPALLFVAIISVINSFQVFDQVYLLTNNGGPGTATYVFNLHVFDNAFHFFEIGYASALAYVLFGILFVITYFQLRIGRSVASAGYEFS